jgi:hypothetical protein
MLCLSEPGLALERADEAARLLVDGRRYRLLTAQPEYFGEEKLFCWAILVPDEEETV